MCLDEFRPLLEIPITTVTICRQCHIHPAVPAGYPAGTVARNLRVKADIHIAPHLAELKLEETSVKIFLH